MPVQLQIELTDLHFFAPHGWHAEESKTGNTFSVSVWASFPVPDAHITSIHETVNYVAVYDIVKAHFAVPEKLLETLASKIAEAVQDAFPQVQLFKISIHKLGAPIAGFSGKVGITYSREFK